MPSAGGKRRQASRFKQQPEKVKPIRLTERDKEIVKALLRYRYLTIDGLVALFGSRKGMQRRMRLLFHHGYVYRRYVVDKMTALPAAKAIYVLDNEGAKLALGDREYERDLALKVSRRKGRTGARWLEHALAVSTFQLALDLAIRDEKKLAVGSFQADKEHKSSAVHVGVAGEEVTIWPDATFKLIDGARARSYTYLLEIDRADRSVKRLARRFEGYWQYVRGRHRPLLRKTLGVSGAFVVFVAPDQRRCDRLRDIALDLDGRRGGNPAFMFLNQHAVSLERPERLLKRPVFQRTDGVERFLLPQGRPTS
jgi:hypothetical protein